MHSIYTNEYQILEKYICTCPGCGEYGQESHHYLSFLVLALQDMFKAFDGKSLDWYTANNSLS